LKINAEDAGVWNNYGVALDGLGRAREALEAYRRATQCHPPSQNAFLGMAFDLLGAGRLDEAADALDQFAKLEPGRNAVVLALRSVLAQRRGLATEAAALEQQARNLDPGAAAWAIKRATNPGPGTAPAGTPAKRD